jgi:hypothetical protein
MAQQQPIDPAQVREVLANTYSPTEAIRSNAKIDGSWFHREDLGFETICAM